MRTTLCAVLALSLCLMLPAWAQGSLVKAWIDPKSSKAVWGQFARSEPTQIFDTDVRTSDRFMPGAGWKLKTFEMVALSPDGQRIAFKAGGSASFALGLYRLQAGTAEILDTSCDSRALTWSPNGKFLAVEDAQGLLNNAVRVVGYDQELGEMEISGDVLSDLGYSAYRFRNDSITGGKDLWRTQVYDARWTSDHALAFKLKRVRYKAAGKAPELAGESAPEDWAFDVLTRKFVRL